MRCSRRSVTTRNDFATGGQPNSSCLYLTSNSLQQNSLYLSSGPRRLQHAVRSPCLPPCVALSKRNLHQLYLLPGAISTAQRSLYPRKLGRGISLALPRRWTHQRRYVLKRFTPHPAPHSSLLTSQYLKNLLFIRLFSAKSLQ